MNGNALNFKRKPLGLKKKEAILGWLFVLPAVLGFGFFTFRSIIYSFYLSLTHYDLLTQPRYIGFTNYQKLFSDSYFYQYFGNTLYFVVFLVPIVLVFSLILAILINKKSGALTHFYRVSLFIPSITSTVAVSMVWLWIFNPDMGLLNNILFGLGFTKVPMWLSSPSTSKISLVIMRVWQMSGYYMILYLAGLQTIPESLYEAADMDGATAISKFLHITAPLLSNTTFVVAILLVIEAFNIFESVFIMTSGGPLGSTSTIMYYIYEKAFTTFEMGYAAAISWIFFLLIIIITLIQYRFRNEQVGE